MTQKVTRVTIPQRANAYGEWVVKVYDQDGKRFAEADYFADSKADAEVTAALMVNPVKELSHEQANCFHYRPPRR